MPVQHDGKNIFRAHAREVLLHGAQAMRMNIRRNHFASRRAASCQNCRFSARRGAQIQDGIAGLHVQQKGNGLRRFVLKRNFSSAK